MSTTQQLLKEMFDRSAAAVLLALTAPLFVFAALLIKCASRGPVLFTQQRIGRHGRPFRIYKFRTMHQRPSGEPDSTVTTHGDRRIFFGGGFLRKWKIDELPQLLNVLGGTMSLVGPRPTTANDYERMTDEQRRRCLAKPGITGLAQINGGAGISWPRRIEFDLAYLANRSLWRDARILASTAALLVTGRADVTPQTDDEWSEPPPAPASQFAHWPAFADDQIEAVTRVLKSGRVNYWTGDEGRLFEEEFAAFARCRHAIAVANGTVALELALYALDVGHGDEVIVPSRTFIASASCVVARGARPVCADVDRDSQNLTRETIEAVVTPQTKAIIAVHLAGWPCDMDPILDLARSRNIAVIEDCAQAHGAEYKGRPVGSMGDVGAFSFCQDKIITTGGEGGMLVTNNTDLWDKAWRYKDHGKTPDAFYNRQPVSSQFRWLHERFGTNFRMTEMQAAIGRIAVRRLPEWVEVRRRNAAILLDTCQGIPALRTPIPRRAMKHSFYKFYSFVRSESLASGWSRDRIIAEIRRTGVPCFSGSCSEIYREDAFPNAWKPTQPHPTARELGQTSLMFLVHPTLRVSEMQRVASAIAEVMRMASDERANQWRVA